MINHVLFRKKDIDYKRGYIYVASCNPLYYELALRSAQSLKDYDPNSNITLFTHADWVDDRCSNVFDEVRVGIPNFIRAKMWCMARTPYDVTIYNDCDSLIKNKKISEMHDQLKDHDMMFGTNLAYTVSKIELAYIDKKRTISVTHHGSMCLYKKTNSTLNFHQRWYDDYITQCYTDWPYEDWSYELWKKFDMFTLWKIINNYNGDYKDFSELNIGLLSRRWNGTIYDCKKDLDGPPVIVQISRETFKNTGHYYKEIESDLKKYRKNKKENNYLEIS